MKKLLGTIGIVGLIAASLLMAATSGTAWAQTETPPASPPAAAAPAAPGHFGMRGRGGLGGEVELEAAAKALSMTNEELSNQLWGGKTLSDLAEEAGVELQTVRDAIEAAQLAATKTAIEQAVTDGEMTRAKADWLLEGLEQGYWDGRGFGGFGPHGGPKGLRGGGTSSGTRSAPSASASDL